MEPDSQEMEEKEVLARLGWFSVSASATLGRGGGGGGEAPQGPPGKGGRLPPPPPPRPRPGKAPKVPLARVARFGHTVPAGPDLEADGSPEAPPIPLSKSQWYL